eukprot:Opistho-2@52834
MVRCAFVFAALVAILFASIIPFTAALDCGSIGALPTAINKIKRTTVELVSDVLTKPTGPGSELVTGTFRNATVEYGMVNLTMASSVGYVVEATSGNRIQLERTVNMNEFRFLLSETYIAVNDDCNPMPCNSGTCTDGVNAFTCTCPAGIVGAVCEISLASNEQRCPRSPALSWSVPQVEQVVGFSIDVQIIPPEGPDAEVNITISSSNRTVAAVPPSLVFQVGRTTPLSFPITGLAEGSVDVTITVSSDSPRWNAVVLPVISVSFVVNATNSTGPNQRGGTAPTTPVCCNPKLNACQQGSCRVATPDTFRCDCIPSHTGLYCETPRLVQTNRLVWDGRTGQNATARACVSFEGLVGQRPYMTAVGTVAGDGSFMRLEADLSFLRRPGNASDVRGLTFTSMSIVFFFDRPIVSSARYEALSTGNSGYFFGSAPQLREGAFIRPFISVTKDFINYQPEEIPPFATEITFSDQLSVTYAPNVTTVTVGPMRGMFMLPRWAALLNGYGLDDAASKCAAEGARLCTSDDLEYASLQGYTSCVPGWTATTRTAGGQQQYLVSFPVAASGMAQCGTHAGAVSDAAGAGYRADKRAQFPAYCCMDDPAPGVDRAESVRYRLVPPAGHVYGVAAFPNYPKVVVRIKRTLAASRAALAAGLGSIVSRVPAHICVTLKDYSRAQPPLYLSAVAQFSADSNVLDIDASLLVDAGSTFSAIFVDVSPKSILNVTRLVLPFAVGTLTSTLVAPNNDTIAVEQSSSVGASSSVTPILSSANSSPGALNATASIGNATASTAAVSTLVSSSGANGGTASLTSASSLIAGSPAPSPSPLATSSGSAVASPLSTTGPLPPRTFFAAPGGPLSIVASKFVCQPSCQGTVPLNAWTATLDDGSGDVDYSSSLNCTWDIKPVGAERMSATFSSFWTEDGKDALAIYELPKDGEGAPAQLLYATGVKDKGLKVVSRGPGMRVRFVSSPSVGYPGWTLQYSGCSRARSCSGHGACNDDGGCTCDFVYDGPNCERCFSGYEPTEPSRCTDGSLANDCTCRLPPKDGSSRVAIRVSVDGERLYSIGETIRAALSQALGIVLSRISRMTVASADLTGATVLFDILPGRGPRPTERAQEAVRQLRDRRSVLRTLLTMDQTGGVFTVDDATSSAALYSALETVPFVLCDDGVYREACPTSEEPVPSADDKYWEYAVVGSCVGAGITIIALGFMTHRESSKRKSREARARPARSNSMELQPVK